MGKKKLVKAYSLMIFDIDFKSVEFCSETNERQQSWDADLGGAYV